MKELTLQAQARYADTMTDTAIAEVRGTEEIQAKQKERREHKEEIAKEVIAEKREEAKKAFDEAKKTQEQQKKEKEQSNQAGVVIFEEKTEVKRDEEISAGEKRKEEVIEMFLPALPKVLEIHKQADSFYHDIHADESDVTPDTISPKVLRKWYFRLRETAEDAHVDQKFLDTMREQVLEHEGFSSQELEQLYLYAKEAGSNAITHPLLQSEIKVFEEATRQKPLSQWSRSEIEDAIERWSTYVCSKKGENSGSAVLQAQYWQEAEKHANKLFAALENKVPQEEKENGEFSREKFVAENDIKLAEDVAIAKTGIQESLGQEALRALDMSVEFVNSSREEKPLSSWTQDELLDVAGNIAELQKAVAKAGTPQQQQEAHQKGEAVLTALEQENARRAQEKGEKAIDLAAQQAKRTLEARYNRSVDKVKENTSLGRVEHNAGLKAPQRLHVAAQLLEDPKLYKTYQLVEKLLEDGQSLEDALNNKDIDEKERAKAKAIFTAHEVGFGKIGKDKQEAGIYNYTVGQLREKKKMLIAAGFTNEQIQALMEEGIVGNGEGELSESESDGEIGKSVNPREAINRVNPRDNLRVVGGSTNPRENQVPADPRDRFQLLAGGLGLSPDDESVQRAANEIGQNDPSVFGDLQRQQQQRERFLRVLPGGRDRESGVPSRDNTPARQAWIESYWQQEAARGAISQEEATEAISRGMLPMTGGAPEDEDTMINVTPINEATYVGTPLEALVQRANELARTGNLDPESLQEITQEVSRTRVGVSPELRQSLLGDLRQWKTVVRAAGAGPAGAGGGRTESARSENQIIANINRQLTSFHTGQEIHTALTGEFGDQIRSLMEQVGYDPEEIPSILADYIGTPTTSAETIKSSLRTLLGSVQRKLKEQREGLVRTPGSIQELCELIMEKSDPDFGRGGRFALLDKEGNFQQDNFLRWLRNQITFWDGYSPDDRMNFFSEIKATTPFRDISFQQMISNDNFFKDRHNKFEVMKTFQEQCLYEVWLFNDSRNWDVDYRRNMGVEKQLASTIQSLYFTNTFTKTAGGETTMGRVLGISKNQEKGDQLIGKGVRRSLLAYNYIHDLGMLRRILGDDAALFQREYDEIVPHPVTKKPMRNPDGSPQTKKVQGGGEGWKASWYDASGRLKFKDDNVRKEFMNYIEIFKDVKRDPRAVGEVRTRMEQSISKASETAARKAGVEALDSDEAAYAEAWAFKMTRWTGLAARSSADSWYKWQKTGDYREGQAEARKHGFYGNPYNVNSFKAVGLNLLDGITDVKGRTLLEIIQGGTGSEVEGLDDDIEKFYFRANTMQKFGDDHINHVYQIFEYLNDGHELHMQDLVKYDPVTGVMKVDEEKLLKIKDGIVKNFRYAYGTWDVLDLTKTVRVKDGDDFKVMTIAERMFGGEILEPYRIKNNPIDYRSLSRDERKKVMAFYGKNPHVDINILALKKDYEDQVFWHNLFRELVTREIQAHTAVGSPMEKWEFGDRERAIQFAEEYFFPPATIAKMRKTAGAGFWKLFFMEVFYAFIAGTIAGGWEAAEELGESVQKAA